MTYASENFWKEYELFVKEFLPRHHIVFSKWRSFCDHQPKRLVDLGCGHSREAERLLCPSEYLGIDKRPPNVGENLIEMDYRSPELVSHLEQYKPNCFSSLFFN